MKWTQDKFKCIQINLKYLILYVTFCSKCRLTHLLLYIWKLKKTWHSTCICAREANSIESINEWNKTNVCMHVWLWQTTEVYQIGQFEFY